MGFFWITIKRKITITILQKAFRFCFIGITNMHNIIKVLVPTTLPANFISLFVRVAGFKLQINLDVYIA